MNRLARSLLSMHCQPPYAALCRHPRSLLQNAILLFFTQQKQQEEETDVLIVGGGVVGCSLADLLRRRVPHLSVGLVEASIGPVLSDDDGANKEQQQPQKPPHPRSYALSPASLELLDIKKHHPPNQVSTALSDDGHHHHRIGYYDSMQIWEANQPACLSFSTKDLENNNNNNNEIDYLGAVVEDSYLVQEMWKRLLRTSSESDLKSSTQKPVHVYRETKVTSVQAPSYASDGLVQVQLETAANNDTIASASSTQTAATTTTTTTRTLQTKLVVAADGANSQLRKVLGIPLAGWDYGQTALTFTVELQHGQTMNARAFQRFLPTGPLALLPTFSPNHAIVVWSTTPEQVQKWKDHPDLCQHINQLLQQGPDRLDPLFSSSQNDSNGSSSILSNILYGLDKFVETMQYAPLLAAAQHPTSNPFTQPPAIATTASQQFAFPLSCRQVTNYAPQPRVALVGDAAHTIHPMAGQGLNLGLQDVAALMVCIEKATNAGMDPSTLLQTVYHPGRVQQVTATLAGIHGLHQIFGVQAAWGKHVKSLGMHLIQNASPIKRALSVSVFLPLFRKATGSSELSSIQTQPSSKPIASLFESGDAAKDHARSIP